MGLTVKTRLISSFVGLLVLAVVLLRLDTLLFNVVIGIISLIAVHELLNATQITKFRSLTILAMAMAVVIPFARAGYVRKLLLEILFVLILLFFIVLLRNHSTMRVEQVAMAFFFSVFVPAFFSCAVYMRDDFGAQLGAFYLLLALGSAWLCDTGAYFTGLRFGKRQLAPVISPKKTVEGAAGGVVFSALGMLLVAFAYSMVMQAIGYPVRVKYLLLFFVTPVFAVIGILGDLSASAIKRGFGVKDYGHIMPGHGGIMDRFDSVLFTLPAVYVLMHHIWIVVPVTV